MGYTEHKAQHTQPHKPHHTAPHLEHKPHYTHSPTAPLPSPPGVVTGPHPIGPHPTASTHPWGSSKPNLYSYLLPGRRITEPSSSAGEGQSSGPELRHSSASHHPPHADWAPPTPIPPLSSPHPAVLLHTSTSPFQLSTPGCSSLSLHHFLLLLLSPHLGLICTDTSAPYLCPAAKLGAPTALRPNPHGDPMTTRPNSSFIALPMRPKTPSTPMGHHNPETQNLFTPMGHLSVDPTTPPPQWDTTTLSPKTPSQI